MRVSYNELLLTSQKVFEGLNHSVGTYEDAAETIAWLELHGMSVLDQVFSQINLLHGPLTPPLIDVQEDVDTERPVTQLRSNGKHLLVCGSFIVDYLMVVTMECGHVSARVEDAADGFFLLPHLARWALNGLEVSASWHENGDDGHAQWHRARFKAQSTFPQLTTIQCPIDKHNDINGKHIFLSLQMSGTSWLGNLPDTAPISNLASCRYPRWFQSRARENISKGIEVKTSLWQAWTRLAKAVLVEATEESRLKGAGEQSAKVNY